MAIVIHVAAVVVAITCGALVLGFRKGTPRHRCLGRVYASAYAVLTLSSFFIFEAGEGLTIFHAVSVVSFGVLIAGLAQPILRESQPEWVLWHLALMQISYLMLVVTGVAQFFDILPLPSAALNAIVFLQLPMVIGFVFIVRSFRRQRGMPIPR